jgi:hypothetical protein
MYFFKEKKTGQKPQKTTLLTYILKYGTNKVLIALCINKTVSIENKSL